MNFRVRLLCCLSLLLVSCDKPPKTHGSGAHEANPTIPPTATKSTRQPREAGPEVREKVRTELDLAKRLPSPEQRNAAIAAIVWNNLDLDPKLSADAFQQLMPGAPERIRLVQHLAMRLAEDDIEQAIQWADALGNPEEIALAYGKISLVLAETDPARAANLLSESGMAGRDFDVVLVQVIQRWAAAAPGDAAAWVALFEPSEARTASMNTVISLWAKGDPPAAFSWIGSLQNAALREEACGAMAAAILQQPPAIQSEWMQHASAEIHSAVEKLKQSAEQQPAD